MSDESTPRGEALGRGLMRVYLELKALTAEYERTLLCELVYAESDARLLRMRHAMQVAVNKLREGLDPSLTESPTPSSLTEVLG